MTTLQNKYNTHIVPTIVQAFNLTTPMQVPRIMKIVLNVGFGNLIGNAKTKDEVLEELTLIAGQKPVLTKAKKSNVNFKLRDGMIIGCKVTLRSDKAFAFLEKVIHIALPRTRDFKGIKADSFDGQANFSFGIKEQIVFPEINYDKISKIRGMDITIVTNSLNKNLVFAVLKEFGLPFRKGKPI